ncbi:hypothetical protein LCGC14_3144770, partial [marine sediment metagenome]
MSNYNIPKSTIVTKPETTQETITRIEETIQGLQDTLAQINTRIERILALEDKDGVLEYPQLQQDALMNRVETKGNEKLLDSLKAQLQEEEQTALV